MAHNTGGGGSSSNPFDEVYLEGHNQFLEIANIGLIMKEILPANAKILKEAKEIAQECVSKFISSVTSEAFEKCKKEQRKMVNGEDICRALESLGFNEYSGLLKRYLHTYREVEGGRANQQDKADDVKDGTAATTSGPFN